MLNPAHILETALLLLAAFLIGATLGTMAKLAFRSTRRLPAAGVPAPVAVSTSLEEAALVTAPIIDPISRPDLPAAPAKVTAPDFTEALVALAGDPAKLAPMPEVKLPELAPLQEPDADHPPALEMGPAHVAGQTTSGIKVPSPIAAAVAAPATTTDGPLAEVIPFPAGPVAAVPEPETSPGIVAPVPESEAVPADPVSSGEPVSAPVAEVRPPSVAPEVGTENVSAVPPLVSDPIEQSPPEPEAVPGPAASRTPPGDEDDEAAAMRAIEGSWSPRGGAVSAAARAELPEDADPAVDASRRAVGAAADAVRAAREQVGRPAGIDAPRDGRKDELTNVIGILPIIETALNSLGLYHFDQVADLSDVDVRWLEGHLGIEGRITREHWREQARELAAKPRSRLAAGS